MKRLLKRRRPQKAAAGLPNASFHVAAKVQAHLVLVTGVCDLMLAVGDVGTYLPRVHINHKFKGKGKDPSQVKAYRPLAQAPPLLYVISDLLQIRNGYRLMHYAGTRQLGGHSDPRYHAIMQRECRTVRRSMGLPTLETSLDAQYGFDGGRHANSKRRRSPSLRLAAIRQPVS